MSEGLERDGLIGPFSTWLRSHWSTVTATAPVQLSITGVDRPTSGYSAETIIVDVELDRAGRREPNRVVLRKETPDPAVYPQQVPGLDVEVEIQFRVMSAVAASSSVPIAPLIGYEADPGVLGSPFFVMGYIGGEVPIESPPYTVEGFYTRVTPGERRQMITEGLRIMSEIHAIDHVAAGLSWLAPVGSAPGTAQQVALWRAYATRELAGRSHPLLDRAFDWLERHPVSDPQIGLCWGDARLGNIIWRNAQPVCVTDFEAASIASPEQDLGWWLMFDRWMHDTLGPGRMAGEPSREEQVQIYADCVRREITDTRFHEIFAAARYGAIVVRVMNRAVARGDLPADQTIWIDNPVVPCLSSILEEYT